MSLTRMLCNQFLPLKDGEHRIGKDTSEVLFTQSYVASVNGEGVDFDKVSSELGNPEIIARVRRVERVSFPVSFLLRTGLVAIIGFVGFNIVKDFPEGTYKIGPVTIRTGDDAANLPPMCAFVEEDYFSRGFSMKPLGGISEIEDSFPIPNSCLKFDEVFEFVEPKES